MKYKHEIEICFLSITFLGKNNFCLIRKTAFKHILLLLDIIPSTLKLNKWYMELHLIFPKYEATYRHILSLHFLYENEEEGLNKFQTEAATHLDYIHFTL